MARIAFIGLGNMGGPMAANLVKRGHEVLGFDLAASVLKAAEASGVKPASHASQAVKDAEIVITMLPQGRHVLTAWTDILQTAAQDTLVIDCSTIDVDSSRKAHEMGQGRRLPVARRARLRRHRRGERRHVDLHGGRLGRGLRQGEADPRGHGQEDRPLRRGGRRPGGKDLQQHDIRHLDGRRLRSLSCSPKNSASRTRRCSMSPRPRQASAGRSIPIARVPGTRCRPRPPTTATNRVLPQR